MQVVCPNCKFDAGDIPEVTIGCNVECDCGHRWLYEEPPPNRPLATPAAADGIGQRLMKASSSIAKSGFGKVREQVSKKLYAMKLPSVFLDAASDGVISEEEEEAIRADLQIHGIAWEDAVAKIKPLTRAFVRRVLADVVADGEVTETEKEEITRYIQLFGLKDMTVEIESVVNRVEAIWSLSNNILPAPLPETPLWLRSGEALYFTCTAAYLKNVRNECKQIMGDLHITNSRFEFISEHFSFSHTHEQLRRCDPARRTHLALLFHPKAGSGTYLVSDAPLVAAYLNALARSANRTISISRDEDGSTVQERKRITREVRHEVWIRDGGKCCECGAEDYLEYDHVIPVSRGGSNTTNNIQLLCRRCNGSKSAKI